MLAKPLSLFLVYLLTIINFLILLSPLFAVTILLIQSQYSYFLQYLGSIDLKTIINLVIFIVTSLMILYLLFDSIFGISVNSSLKNCKKYTSYKELEFLKTIFNEVKQKFGRKDIQLYIKNSNEINAYAIGSIRKKAIVLTNGLIQHAMNNSADKKEFMLILRSIMGHEMSHLTNKDYLPGLLLIINKKATKIVSKIISFTFKTPLIIMGYIKFRSRIIFDLIIFFYNIINVILTAFNNHIIMNFYQFINKFISKSVEYRCDKQSAQAFGGYNMAKSLTLFGDSGYFTLFSTHPQTKKRIKKTLKVSRKNKIIRPLISSSIANYLAFMALFASCAISAKLSKADQFIRYQIKNQEAILETINHLYNSTIILINFLGL